MIKLKLMSCSDFSISLVGAIVVYWWIKNELNKQKKELETRLTKQDQEIAQAKLENEQELKRIQELEQQLVKFESLSKKGNHPNWGSEISKILTIFLIKWGLKKFSG